jgi:hypothetical protein
VVERVRLQALIDELNLVRSPLADPQNVPRLGQLLGARWIVGGGRIMQKEALLEIKCRLLDLPRDLILGEAASQGLLAELFEMEKALLNDIVRMLNITPTPQERAALQAYPTTSLKALLLLFNGLAAGDQGRYAAAAQYYRQSLAQDPGLSAAQEYLNELEGLGLTGAGTDPIDLLHSLRERTSLTDGLLPQTGLRRVFTPGDLDLALGPSPPPDLPLPPSPPAANP